jgi:hypothetical protein
MLRILIISLHVVFFLTLAACDVGDSEARKLGFSNKKEMLEIQANGYHTKAKYEEMKEREESRKKPLKDAAK